MKNSIELNLLIDETGIKNSNDFYICRICKRRANSDKVQKEVWYYKINGIEKDLINLGKSELGYVPVEKVIYLCNEHFKTLPEEESFRFVEVGLPYFLSIIRKKGVVFSF